MHKKSTEDLLKELETARAKLKKLESTTAELKKVREELRESEARYRTAFEYTGTAMIVIDEDTTISMANHKLEEITGYGREESIRKKKWTDVVVPEDARWMREYHKKRRTSPDSVPDEYEFRMIDKNNQIRDMLLNATMIPGTGQSLVSLVDITRLKRSEHALRDSERKYRELFENANDILYTIDLEGNFTSANNAALRTYGYTADEMQKTNMRQLIDPSHLELVQQKIADKLSHSISSAPYELLTRTKDGKAVWVEVSTRLIRDAERSVGIQGIARDITERKLHEKELRESQDRFRETADLLPGIICELDLSMKLTYVNELGLTSFGYTREDFERGVSVLELVPENDRERFSRDVYNVTHGDFGNPKLYELYKKDMSKLQLIVNSAPIVRDGKVTGIRSCLIDISDRVRAEIRLRESEERFRSVYDSSPIGIALFDPEGHLIDHNESFTRMFNVPEHLFKKDTLFSVAGIGLTKQSALFKGTPVNVETETRVDRKKSTVRWFEWHLSAIGLPENEPSMYLAQVQDITVKKEAQEARLQKERDATARAEALVAGLRQELKEHTAFHNIISRSPDMKQIFDILPEVANASATVLINGDSGTGKELVARSLHDLSNRKKKPFIAVNCSALPDNLLESELFGYKSGAFTDAKKDKPGRFALAEGGTLFLDEIGDISAAMQVKLLRVLQEKTYEPLGATTPVKADVRVIVATNRNLAEMVNRGEFREDLYYRINVVSIKLPPLKKRRCDIPLLCDHFIGRFNKRYEKSIEGLSDEALQLLMSHEFPGNIRELENIIEHAFIFCKNKIIDSVHLPSFFTERTATADSAVFAKITCFEELERMYLKSMLSECNGNKSKAAERLGIHKATLFRKLKQLAIDN